MAAITEFSKLVVIALGQSLKYLKTFNIADALRETRFFAKFTERTHMLLNANTLTNLYAPVRSHRCSALTERTSVKSIVTTRITPLKDP